MPEKGPSAVARSASAETAAPMATGSGYVTSTLCLDSNVLLSGNANTCPNRMGLAPMGAAFDSGNGDLYFILFESSNVSVVSGSTNTVVANVSGGLDPWGVTFDSLNGDVYVVNDLSNDVSVIAGSTNTVIATIPVGSLPRTAAFDPANGDVYVINYQSDNVSVVSGSTNKVIATISVGSSPQGAVYDTSDKDMYVTNTGSDSVSILAPGTPPPTSNSNSAPTFLGLPGYVGYLLIGTIAAIVVVALAVVMSRKREPIAASPPQVLSPAPAGPTPPTEESGGQPTSAGDSEKAQSED